MSKKKFKTVADLPNKLSDLLELAVSDARKCQKSPRFKFDMTTWLDDERQGRKGVCYVCMAGAVMAQTLGLKSPLERWDNEALRKKTSAIDSMRGGNFDTASLDLADEFDYVILTEKQTRKLSSLTKLVKKNYSKSKATQGRANWATYDKCVRELRKVGL